MSRLLPASDLPGTRTSSSFPPVEDEKTKGRTWNGYVCPGCRTVFRVSADFIGAEVMCPSCRETLRLPKTPEQVRPHILSLESPTVPATASDPAQPARPATLATDAGPSVLRSMLSTTNGRLKLTLALFMPLAFIAGAFLLFPPEEFTLEKIVLENAPLFHPESTVQEKPAPPPPPIAVSEMPVPAPPSLPQPQETEQTPVPEIAAVQPVPKTATPISEAVTELVESAPVIPEPSPDSLAVVEIPEPGLVETIPAIPVPAPEQPVPPPVVLPQPETTATLAEPVHTVVRGDTLTKISRKYQVGIATIKKANGMKSDAVMLGQKLKIPGAIEPAAIPAPPIVVETPAQAPQADRSHTVVRGDTLVRIARKNRVTPQQIMQANGMKNDVVRLGRKLVIPAAP